MSQVSMLLEAYAKDPVNQYVMDDPTVSYKQGNEVCGDSCVVYLKIEDEHIKELSHAGDPSIHTLAAVSLLAEHIADKKLDEVLDWGYSTMKSFGFEVSPRRQRSAVTGLLATKNAIHQYLEDRHEETYDEILEM